MPAAISGNYQAFGLRELFQKIQACRRAEHKHGCCQSIAEGDTVRDNGDTLAFSCGHTGLRIEDMVITHAILFKKALIISRSDHSTIADLDRFEHALLFAGILDADAPGTLRASTEQVHIATGIDRCTGYAMLLEDRYRSIDSIAFGNAAEVKLQLWTSLCGAVVLAR